MSKASEWGEIDARVLRYLRGHGPVRSGDIASALVLNRGHVRASLHRLRLKGKARFETGPFAWVAAP